MEGTLLKMMMMMMLLFAVISTMFIGMGSAQPSRCRPGQCPRIPECCGISSPNNITKLY
ncbi:unnamed protein product [Lupinus luteus]|uniref:Uncharacterized protein n=1 Tax=Lupinus luteus TaxID=3873 RepID=A0AAV1Y9T4_LUPLU